ncbi:MAG: hypothetical protein ACXWCW_22125 [Burkholderiales bacterium]
MNQSTGNSAVDEAIMRKVGLRTVTLRKYYETFNKITLPSRSDRERQEKLFRVEFQGAPLGDTPLRIADDDPLGRRFEKVFGEVLDLARVLLAAGLNPVSIMPQSAPMPDTLVRFDDDSEQYIEVGRIMHEGSASRAGAIDYLKYALAEKFVSDEGFRNKLCGTHVTITFGTVPLKTGDKNSAINEIIGYFSERKFLSLPSPLTRKFDANTPTLEKYGASFVAASRKGWFFSIQQPPMKADTNVAVGQFHELLAKKQKANYTSPNQPWLAMMIDDVEQAEAEALAAIAPELQKQSLGQFARIIVGYERGAATIPNL